MTTMADIAQIILLMQAAFPNYHPEVATAALNHFARADGVPSEFEAWDELCRMPESMERSTVALDESGQVVRDECGAVFVQVERLAWSHPLVEKAARLMGWPDFPGRNESLDRAHFYQAYRSLLSRRVEDEGELPAVKKYLEDLRRQRGLASGTEVKKLMDGLPHEDQGKDKKMNRDEKLEEMKIPLPRKYESDEEFYEELRRERLLVWVVLVDGNRQFVHLDRAGLEFSDPCWRWIWEAFRSLHAAGQPGGLMPPERNPAPAWTAPGQAGTTPAGQPGGLMPPERNPAGTTPAGQPVELPAVRDLLIKQGHWDQVKVRLLEIDYPRQSIQRGDWRWGKVM